MPHQCTNCTRVFDDGSKEMLSGCPNCGGNKFQFKPEGADASVETTAEPPEPPEPPGSSSVARTVGKTAATVRDLMGSSDSADPAVGADGADPVERSDPAPLAQEDTAQASARSDVVTPDELPAHGDTETEHRFQPARGEGNRDAHAGTPATDADAPADASTQPSHAGGRSTATTDDAPEPSENAARPDLEELRAELNDQFESIKVLSPGHYELNLMELYDREEYIVALQEDGRYSIQVPENFRD